MADMRNDGAVETRSSDERAAAELREKPDVKEFYLGLSDEGRKSYRDVPSYRRRKRWLS